MSAAPRWLLRLLAAGLLLPLTASAQDEATDEAEQESPSDEPPPPPRKLKKALQQLQAKEWPLASLSLHAVLQDDDAAYYHPDVRYYLAFSLEQMGLNYSALEEYNRYFLSAPPDSSVLDKAIKRAVTLGKQMDAGVILGAGLAGIDTSMVTAGYQGPAMYWVGRHHYDEGNLAAARAFLRLVPKNTADYAEARMLEGVSHVREGNLAEAIAPLAAAVQAAQGEPGGNTWEVANMNLARAYYALGNFERAVEHFEKTPRSSNLWFESLYEASWGYFRLGRYSGALAHLQTVDSPFFDGVYHPEATLLRILIFYYLCKYIDGQTMLDEFTAEHYPIQKEIDEALARAEENPTQLFDALYAWNAERRNAGVALPDPIQQYFATDESLLSIGDYLVGIDGEIERMGRIESGWEKSALKADVQAELTRRKQTATDDKGRQILAQLQGMSLQLGGHLGSAELYKVEMITAEKDIYDAAFQGRLSEKIATRKLKPDVPGGYRWWPFEGEYWVDELGWFEVNTINECLAIQR